MSIVSCIRRMFFLLQQPLHLTARYKLQNKRVSTLNTWHQDEDSTAINKQCIKKKKSGYDDLGHEHNKTQPGTAESKQLAGQSTSAGIVRFLALTCKLCRYLCCKTQGCGLKAWCSQSQTNYFTLYLDRGRARGSEGPALLQFVAQGVGSQSSFFTVDFVAHSRNFYSALEIT